MDPNKNSHPTELLRWIGVLPAAVLGGVAGLYIGGLVSRVAAFGWGTAAESAFVYYLQLVVLYMPKKALFVIAGTKMAPRRRLPTALILAAAAILMSLIVHVLGQPNPGLTNYTHFAAEAVGAAFGMAYMLYSEKRRSQALSDNSVTL